MEKLDLFGSRFTLRIHRLVHRVTGWSNFKSARVSLHLGVLLWVARDVMLGVQAKTGWGHAWYALFLLFDWYVWQKLLGIFSRVQEAWTEAHEFIHLPLSPSDIRMMVMWRVLWFYLGFPFMLADALTLRFPVNLGTCFLSCSIYFAFQWQPPAKSLARRAVESLKKAASNVRVPVLLPRPVPIPVGT